MIRTVLPLLLVIATIGTGMVLLKTPPEVPRSERPTNAAVVGVAELSPQRVPVFVRAFGSVVAARETRVQAEVAGRIVRMHEGLTAGGLIGTGETLLELDNADYEIAVDEATAEVEVARRTVDGIRAGVESLRARARQIEAELDFLSWNLERLGDLSAQDQAAEAEARDAQSKYVSQKSALISSQAQTVEQERLVDRAVAQAAVAESRLAAARLALTRTSLTAPFDAVVLSESVEVGQLVRLQDTVATLAATDVFWVEAAMPVARLKELRFSDGTALNGSAVKVTLVTGEDAVSRDGVTLRKLGQLDPKGRMAKVLIAVQDPLRLRAAARDRDDAILLGSYVHLSVAAGTLEDVYAIPRYALRENSRIWVCDAKQELAIRDVEVVWRRQDDVLILDGFQAGDQLVTTHLASVVPGMPLSIREEPTASPAATNQPTTADQP